MSKSRLPEGGQNLFQKIKKRVEAAEEAGKKIWRLGIGQPSGPALISAREAAAIAVMSGDESMHEYQDNGSPGVPGFAERVVHLHQKEDLIDGLAYLPTPGIKLTLFMIPLSCGHIGIDNLGTLFKDDVLVATMTDPGYPTPADCCQMLRVPHYPLRTNPENEFLFSCDDILPGTTLLMVNFPHNPSGQIATKDFWEERCAFCEEKGIRLYNDAAYSMLTYNNSAVTLGSVAQHFSRLEWAESISASKLISNGTGWRIAATYGTYDFIKDIETIKGNFDSGFFAPAACGVLASMEYDMPSILECRDVYCERNTFLCDLLQSKGMRLAVKPGAGFFSLWKIPSEAFGLRIENSEQFNYLMLDKAGVVGVHFDQYIRYSVTSPILKPEWQEAIKNAFVLANVKY